MQNKQPRSQAKSIASIAVMTALLIGGQLAFSYAVGIEVITVLLACYAFVYGVRCGVLSATAFSLLRCFIWGFYPAVVVLYLIYYPLFAAIFGLLGKVKGEVWENPPLWLIVTLNAALATVIFALGLCLGLDLIKISVLLKQQVYGMLWVVLALFSLLLLAFDVALIIKKVKNLRGKDVLQCVLCTAVAGVCAACFTLLDDIISPLILGMTQTGALAYFYASFTALLPQTAVAVITVGALFLPLTKLLKKL